MNSLTKTALTAAAGYALLHAGRVVVRHRRRFDWRGRRVVITGGSRGLGLVIARHVADKGGRLAICARSADSLDIAVDELRARGTEVNAEPCDVREREQVANFFQAVDGWYGGVDVLINVAGIMVVGPVDAMTMEDFHDSMNTNCWGALHTSLEAIPMMRRQQWGRIVNIASIGGKRAVPHMLPYAASKFALLGLSTGLRSELKGDNIFVTTVCPGLMRTGSPRNATFKGKHRDEYAWFSIGDSLPLLSMNANSAARQILAACEQGRGEVLIGNRLNITNHLQGLFPELTQEVLDFANRLLPEMGGIGKQAAKGFHSKSVLSESMLTYLTQRAAIANNEIRP